MNTEGFDDMGLVRVSFSATVNYKDMEIDADIEAAVSLGRDANLSYWPGDPPEPPEVEAMEVWVYLDDDGEKPVDIANDLSPYEYEKLEDLAIDEAYRKDSDDDGPYDTTEERDGER